MFLMKFSMSNNCSCSPFNSSAITDLQQLVYLVLLSVQCNYLLQLCIYHVRLSAVFCELICIYNRGGPLQVQVADQLAN